MKNLFSAALVSTLFTISCTYTSTSNREGFTINGKIDGIENGSVIVLTPIATHKDEKPIALDTVRDGKFKLEGKLDDARLFSLRAENHYGGYELLISNENVTFKGKFSSFSNESYSSCSFDDVKIKGASLQNEYLSKIKVREDMDKIYNEYNSRFNDFYKSLSEARKNKDTLTLKELTESETYAEMNKTESEFFNTVQKSYTDLITANKNSFFGPMLMLNLLSYFGDEQKSWFENFSEEAKESYYGKQIGRASCRERVCQYE